MVAPLFLAQDCASLRPGDTYELIGVEGKHAATVKRMRVGEAIQLTDAAGLRIEGVVTSVAKDSLSISIKTVNLESKPGIQITLVQALAKGDRDELAIQAATELGAVQVIPWQASRSISRWEGSKAEKSRMRWQSIVEEAAKQSLRVYRPEVLEIHSTKQLIERLKSFDLVLILEPSAKSSIAEVDFPTGQITLVVGPEGGISQEELDLFEAAGFTQVKMGSGVLRTSTAGLAAISYIAGKSGLWD